MAYAGMDVGQLAQQIFTAEDRLGPDYLEEVKKRRGAMLPLLCEVLFHEENYDWEDGRGWGVIHSVYLLGILADLRSVDALLEASGFAADRQLDWIAEALPECYARLGSAIIPRLQDHIRANVLHGEPYVVNEILGLWNLWHDCPEVREGTEAFLLELLMETEGDFIIRTNLMADFAQAGRRDLKTLFRQYYERGEADLETVTWEDLEAIFEERPNPPISRRTLEDFYAPEAIREREEHWAVRDAMFRQRDWEDWLLENMGRIGLKEPCPCGSGGLFEQCHLPWAEKERDRLLQEDEVAQSRLEARTYISQERAEETALRRFLAARGQADLFPLIKRKALEIARATTSKSRSRGFTAAFQTFFGQVEFRSKDEFNEFMEHLTAYYNALTGQFADHPGNGQRLH
jgi:hypothetical protein